MTNDARPRDTVGRFLSCVFLAALLCGALFVCLLLCTPGHAAGFVRRATAAGGGLAIEVEIPGFRRQNFGVTGSGDEAIVGRWVVAQVGERMGKRGPYPVAEAMYVMPAWASRALRVFLNDHSALIDLLEANRDLAAVCGGLLFLFGILASRVLGANLLAILVAFVVYHLVVFSAFYGFLNPCASALLVVMIVTGYFGAMLGFRLGLLGYLAQKAALILVLVETHRATMAWFGLPVGLLVAAVLVLGVILEVLAALRGAVDGPEWLHGLLIVAPSLALSVLVAHFLGVGLGAACLVPRWMLLGASALACSCLTLRRMKRSGKLSSPWVSMLQRFRRSTARWIAG